MFDWITGLIRSSGYPGIALLMLAENIFPPIPSELIMPLAGFLSANDDLSLPLVITAGSIGSLIGLSFWYWVGLKLGTERLKRFSDKHGRWLTMSRRDIERADAWFDRYGGWAVMIGRLIPTVRTLISVPAGVSDMKFRKFILFSAIGTFTWTALLTMAGYWLQGSYDVVANYVGPVSNVVVAGLAVIYSCRVITFKSKPN